MRILMVDDDEEILLVAAFALGQDPRFAAVFTAQGGASGLEVARTEAPELILTDFRMAGLDGLQLMKAIRTLPGMAMTPVIFCTGKRQPEFLRNCLEAGAAGIICKPFHPLTLADDVFRIVRDGNILVPERYGN